MEFATSPTLTGNPGQPRDLQFRGPFLEMFSVTLRPKEAVEQHAKHDDAYHHVYLVLLGSKTVDAERDSRDRSGNQDQNAQADEATTVQTVMD